MTITEFLTARLDEDEAMAREVGDPTSSYHEPYRLGIPMHHSRVLAEVEAKRRIVRWVERLTANLEDLKRRGEGPSTLVDPLARWSEGDMTLRFLSAVYSDHPDYDEEWWV